MEKKLKNKKHYIIKGVIGILLSLPALPMFMNIGAFLFLGIIPLVCSILFLIKKHPAFGITYTALFFVNRIAILLNGLLLAQLLILLLLAYFIYADWISIKDLKDKKECIDELQEI